MVGDIGSYDENNQQHQKFLDEVVEFNKNEKGRCSHSDSCNFESNVVCAQPIIFYVLSLSSARYEYTQYQFESDGFK